MSKFFERVFDKHNPPDDVPPVVPEPVIPEPAVPEPVVPEPVVDTPPPPVVPEPATPAVPEPEVPVPSAKKKVLIDVSTFLQENRDVALKLLQEKDKDFSALADSEALRLRLQRENPDWTASDIDEELQEKYGVGVELEEIDEATMTEEEIRLAKARNTQLRSAKRSLKKDGGIAKQFLADEVKDITLPQLEHEVDDVQPAQPVDIEEEFSQRMSSIEAQAQESREKEWIPAIDSTLKTISNIKETVEYDVIVDGKASKVTLDLDVVLTPEDKQQVLDELSHYVGQKGDEKFLGENDVVDYQAFIQEKSGVILRSKINAQIAQQAAQQAVQDYVRGNVINYTPTVRDTGSNSQEEGSFAKAIWGNRKSKR